MERSSNKKEPSLLTTTLDLIDNFAREVPSSLPEGWTSNIFVSLVANKLSMNNYGSYYNYCIERESDGESSLDKESQSSYGSDRSFEVFFPTVQAVLDYYLDPRLYESSQDLKLCEQRQTTQLIVEEDSNVTEEKLEKAVAARGYKLVSPAQSCILKGVSYIKLRLQSYRQAYKAYKLLAVEQNREDKVSFLLKRMNKTVPPAVILRNVPEKITLDQLKQKIREVSNVEVLEYVKPFRLRETYNTIVTASSMKDCEVICYYLHRKNIFFKGQIVKVISAAMQCTVHPLSMRSAFDTNFTEYIRPNTLNITYSQLVPHWEELRSAPLLKKASTMIVEEDQEEGQITTEPIVTINHYEPRQPQKRSSRTYK